MNLKTQQNGKNNMSINTEYVYVVTRNKRRVEPVSYKTISEAQERAAGLVETLKKWKDPDYNKVSITKTKHPHTIT